MEMRYVAILALALLAIVFVSGCTEQPLGGNGITLPTNGGTTPPTNGTGEPTGDGGQKEELDIVGEQYTMEEVEQHNSGEDCWLVINGGVYDVTGFIASHPGGNTIIEGCGTDATQLFETRPMGSGTPHSQDARMQRDQYYTGDLAQ